MLKLSVMGSVIFVPALLLGCGSDNPTGESTAGTGGAIAAGMNAGGTGGAHANGGTSGALSGPGGNTGDDSAAGAAGSEEMAGAAGESGSSSGSDVGVGGSSAGREGVGGNAGTAGSAAGASAGHGGSSGGAGSGGGAAGHSGATSGGAVCSTSAQCASSQVCLTNVCTPCDNVAYSGGNTIYFVDPTSGNDSNGTGSAKAGGQAVNACAFKTITRALQVIGSPTQASGAIVKLKGNAGTTSGETFPISVPRYVVIQGATAPVTVTLAAGKVGVVFAGTGSTLKDLVLEGGGTSDIGVRLPTADATATLDAVTVQNTGGTGVDVQTGTLTLLAGTLIQTAGTSAAHQEGIRVEGTGKLVAKLSTGKVSVVKNTGQGIHVLGRGSVSLEGAVTNNTATIPTSYTGTIVINQNNEANIELNQSGAGATPMNSIKGVLGTGSVESDGLLILGGTAAYVRKSVFVGNALSGIHLSHTGTKTSGVNDVTAVDLGKNTDPGLNVLQGANSQLNNKGSGICINLDPAGTQLLSAQGNVFATTNCTTTATLTKNLGVCGPVSTKPGDLGWEWVTSTNTSKVTVDATRCN